MAGVFNHLPRVRYASFQVGQVRRMRHAANAKKGDARPMSTFPQNQPYSGTYFVQDQQNEGELLRLVGQDRTITASMGGVLPEQTDPSAFRRVLDIAC